LINNFKIIFMMETPPMENNWQKTGQGVHFGEEKKDPQSKIWLRALS
jgi:hypothetical protein